MHFLFADISLPLWVVVSQWVLIFALGCLVIIAYRQLGYVMHLKEIGSEGDGLAIGQQAPTFTYTSLNQAYLPERFDPNGKWSLLLFADPGCVSCQNALRALHRLAPELTNTQILVVTSADPALVAAVEEFRTASVPISRSERDVPFKLYQTHSTPFMYVIDPKGEIRAKGIVGDESSMRKIVRNANRSVVQVVPHPK